AQYDALTHHLDQDYEDDSEVITQARASVNRLRNMNYPGIERVLAHFAGIPDEGYEKAFFAFRDTDLFRDTLRPRVEIEYPRLRRMADDITARVGNGYR
ncbi:MAG TPA: hypothetical protein PL152_06525, partial [Steroidobacteraceae bacterium]|nr:hypothetical protein [Steroidobacteraceae bacterium]